MPKPKFCDKMITVRTETVGNKYCTLCMVKRVTFLHE